MKSFYPTRIILPLILLILSCREKDTIPPGEGKPDVPETGEYTAAVGMPAGALIERTIGPAGGVISDSSGRFSVSIPAGALSAAVTVGLQPISSTNAVGKGAAYRLTPHGQQFQKPVTVQVHYSADDLEGTIPEALGIAYQNKDKVWMAVGGARLDTTRKTLAVHTTHFSDWDLFESVRMVPAVKAIDPGQQITLSVRRWKPASGDELFPLIPETQEVAMMQITEPLDPAFITGWELQGEGKLTASGNAGAYQAPGHIPNRNPVEVLVKLKSAGKAVGFAISRIYVAPKGVSVQIAGGAWRTLHGSGMNRLENINLVNALEDGHGITVMWQGPPTGTFHWTMETVVCSYNLNGKESYVHLYGMAPSISSGGVTANLAGEDEHQIAVGHFEIPSAGHVDARIPDHLIYNTSSLRGVYRVEIY